MPRGTKKGKSKSTEYYDKVRGGQRAAKHSELDPFADEGEGHPTTVATDTKTRSITSRSEEKMEDLEDQPEVTEGVEIEEEKEEEGEVEAEEEGSAEGGTEERLTTDSGSSSSSKSTDTTNDNNNTGPLKKKDKKAEKKLLKAQQRKETLQEKKKSVPSSLTPQNPFIERIDDQRWRVKIGYVPNMRVEGRFYANDRIAEAILEEMAEVVSTGFLPAVKQLANVASLPGIVGASLGMPDMHSGYGFSIGGVAAIDYDSPEGVVSPGGVGFDINCGVRLLRTNIPESQALEFKQKLAQALYDSVPAGVGSKGGWGMSTHDLDEILGQGMEWALKKGYVWPEDLAHCEAGGRLPLADPKEVSDRAKARGLSQTGTLGSGNHYLELQLVDEVYDPVAAEKMGLKKGNLCIMIHSGSRGLGHQVCTDFLQSMGKAKEKVVCNDRQLTGVKINSPGGKSYIAAMCAAANYAFVNRSLMTAQTRLAFQDVFKKTARELDMHLVYDVAHNIAKVEDHVVNGQPKRVLVHRKGATRAFPPGHPEIPEEYREIGQPVIIGGSMGTSSYVLTGTQKAMEETFGSTCHGAGRALSRSAAMRELKSSEVLKLLASKGITVKVASPKLIAEEASEAYKNIDDVVDTCHNAGITKKCVRLRPIAVIKG